MKIAAAVFAAGAALASIPFCAFAADMPTKAPPTEAVVAARWAGFYAGLNAGYAWAAGNRWTGDDPVGGAGNNLLNTAFTGVGSFGFGAYRQAPAGQGFTGGVQIGYNWQFASPIVAGLEADFQYADLDGSAATVGLDAPFLAVAVSDHQMLWFGTVRARIGALALDQRLLAYVTGGFAYGHTKISAVVFTNYSAFSATSLTCGIEPVCIAGSDSGTSIGWTAGAGFEWQLWNNTRFKIEYLHVDLGDQTIRLVAQPPSSGDGFADVRFQHVFDVVRAGVNFAF
jgi:outer membrane immunogenic protein